MGPGPPPWQIPPQNDTIIEVACTTSLVGKETDQPFRDFSVSIWNCHMFLPQFIFHCYNKILETHYHIRIEVYLVDGSGIGKSRAWCLHLLWVWLGPSCCIITWQVMVRYSKCAGLNVFPFL